MAAHEGRSAAEIREQLADLRLVIAKAEKYGERDFAAKLGLQSMRAHEQKLLAELQAAEAREG